MSVFLGAFLDFPSKEAALPAHLFPDSVRMSHTGGTALWGPGGIAKSFDLLNSYHGFFWVSAEEKAREAESKARTLEVRLGGDLTRDSRVRPQTQQLFSSVAALRIPELAWLCLPPVMNPLP